MFPGIIANPEKGKFQKGSFPAMNSIQRRDLSGTNRGGRGRGQITSQREPDEILPSFWRPYRSMEGVLKKTAFTVQTP